MRTLLMALALAIAAPPAAAAAAADGFSAQDIAFTRDLERLINGSPSPDEALRRLDAMARRLKEPRQKGLVALARSHVLNRLNRPEEARKAAAEAIRLMPGDAAPLLAAADIEIYADRPREAVDLIARAEEAGAAHLAHMPEYDVGALVSRLTAQNEQSALETLARILFLAGWKGAADTEAALGLALIEARLRAGDTAGATPLLPRIVYPEAVRRLVTERRFGPVRDQAAAQAGPRFEKMWAAYLSRTSADWLKHRHERALTAYAHALRAADHFGMLLATFMPVVEASDVRLQQHALLHLSPSLSEALARRGEWERAYALLERVAARWPENETVLGMNARLAHAWLLLNQGRAAEALAGFDRALAHGARFPEQVSEANFARIHGRRACSLHVLGREARNSDSWRFVAERRARFPNAFVEAALCLDEPELARAVLLEAMGNEATWDDVVGYMQPPPLRPFPSALMKRIAAHFQQMRTDPELREAALRHVRFLEEPMEAGAPPDPIAPAPPLPQLQTRL